MAKRSGCLPGEKKVKNRCTPIKIKVLNTEKTDVTHIIRTHLEGKKYKTHRSTLVLKNGKWYIISKIGHLKQ